MSFMFIVLYKIIEVKFLPRNTRVSYLACWDKACQLKVLTIKSWFLLNCSCLMTNCYRCQVLCSPLCLTLYCTSNCQRLECGEFILCGLVEDCQDWDFWKSLRPMLCKWSVEAVLERQVCILVLNKIGKLLGMLHFSFKAIINLKSQNSFGS